MTIPRGVRFAASLLLGAAAAVFMWTRLEPLNPFLDVRAQRTARTDTYELWVVLVTARGGETIPEVTIESASKAVRVLGNGRFQGLRSGQTRPFQVEVDAGARGTVRVTQLGRVENTSEVWVGGAP